MFIEDIQCQKFDRNISQIDSAGSCLMQNRNIFIVRKQYIADLFCRPIGLVKYIIGTVIQSANQIYD